MLQEAVIHTEHVSRQFGRISVLDRISLQVARGEIFGLLGPSGAGKTTLVKLIAGIDEASSGEVRVLGSRMPKLDTLRRIGYMAQSEALYADLTAKENLQFFASLYGLSGAARRRRIAETIELVNLSEYMNRQVHRFSGGMKRRLSLAAALLHEPEVLILDEPTVGIDPAQRQSIWRKLAELSELGTTVIVTTHVMDEAYKCRRLGMIRDGRLIATGSPQQLMSDTGTTTIEDAFLHYGGGGQ